MSADDFVDQRVESKIVDVTVYEDKAQVHRTAKVSLAQSTRLVFEDLPSSLDRESLQVALLDGAGVVLKGIGFDTITRPNEKFALESEGVRVAQTRIAQLKERIQELQDEIQQLQHAAAFVENCFNKAVGATKEDHECVADVATWKRLVDVTSDSSAEKRRQWRQLEDQVRVLSKELRAAEGNARVSVAAYVSKQVVTVSLRAPEPAVGVTVMLSYMVSQASWHAEYDVRLDSATVEAVIGYSAVVQQTTEEAWNDVRLTLSTARPSQAGTHPELQPWRVSLQERVNIAKKRGASGGGRRANDADLRRERCNEEAELEEDDEDGAVSEGALGGEAPAIEAAAMHESATSFTFTVGQPQSITRDGEPRRVPLLTFRLKARMTYTVVPSVTEAAFARVTFTNSADYVLVAGAATVFLDGQLCTKTTLERVAPSEEFSISVGRDDGVSVKRKLLNKQRADQGSVFSTKKNVVAHRYCTTLRNGKTIPVTLKLQERIPISDNSNLVVALIDPPELKTDAQRRKKEEEGIIEMEIVLAPSEKQDVLFSFDVSYPKEETVYGM